MTRCLVTGGSGFLGAALTRRLVRDGHEVTVISRDPRPWRLDDCLDAITIVPGELAALSSALARVPLPDVVFHLAWSGGDSRAFAADAVHLGANLDATRELLAWIERHRVPRFVGLGTCLEYGRFPVPVSEDAPCVPDSAYGEGKLAAGRAALAAKTSAAWVRLFWTYGPADSPARLVPSVALSLLDDEAPAVTPGGQLWDYLYVDDAIDALMRLGNDDAARGVFNLGSGSPVAIRSVVEAIAASCRARVTPRFGALPYPQGQTMHLQADVTRLTNATGWQAATPLADGIAATVAWFAAHRERYARDGGRWVVASDAPVETRT